MMEYKDFREDKEFLFVTTMPFADRDFIVNIEKKKCKEIFENEILTYDGLTIPDVDFLYCFKLEKYKELKDKKIKNYIDLYKKQFILEKKTMFDLMCIISAASEIIQNMEGEYE